MKGGGGAAAGSTTAVPRVKRLGGMSTRGAWAGEPRVIYHDVSDRIESLKSSRSNAESTNSDGSDGVGGNSGDGSGGNDSSSKRFVGFMFDLPGPYSETRHRLPQISVIDAEGKEKRKWYHGRDLGPLDVGSVIVLRSRNGGTPIGTPIAAYFVGEEENQVCSAVLLCVPAETWF